MTEQTVTLGRMETLVLLRDECRALANALDNAMMPHLRVDRLGGMVDGLDGEQLRELRRRAIELAGSLSLWVGGQRVAIAPGKSIAEQIEEFLDEQDVRDELEQRKAEYATLAFEHGQRYGALFAELEQERIASARLRDELAISQSIKVATEEHAQSCERQVAKLMLELEQVRSLVGRA